MKVLHGHESVRLTGRWDTRNEAYAATTAKGAYIEFAFKGKEALACFDIGECVTPRAHLWVQIDGGDMVETAIDSYVRVMAKDDNAHVCRIIYKSSIENENRWFAPLTGAIKFLGVITDSPLPIGSDDRTVIEFVGDSITEGVHTDFDFYGSEENIYCGAVERFVFQNDVCATYAWQIAEALDLRPIVMGYGGGGVTAIAIGHVPEADISYPFNYDGSPITHAGLPKYIVVNHGANDRRNPDTYLPRYASLFDILRKYNPDATIISISAFCGAYHKELGEMIKKYNEENGCNIIYIDSAGWVPEEPLHPTRESHTLIASKVVSILKEHGIK